MMRSFHYAMYAAAPEAREPGQGRASWADKMAAAFLDGYLNGAGRAAFVPNDGDRLSLLRAYLMEKALYELGYELNHRPDWAHIPMLGILKLIKGQSDLSTGKLPSLL